MAAAIDALNTLPDVKTLRMMVRDMQTCEAAVTKYYLEIYVDGDDTPDFRTEGPAAFPVPSAGTSFNHCGVDRKRPWVLTDRSVPRRPCGPPDLGQGYTLMVRCTYEPLS